MTRIEASLPDELVAAARQYVSDGSAGDFDSLMAEALRRHLESHDPELTESFIRQDVEWGLHGSD